MVTVIRPRLHAQCDCLVCVPPVDYRYGVCVEHDAGYRAADAGGNHKHPGTAVDTPGPQATVDLDTIRNHGISARITAWYHQMYMRRNSGAGGRLYSPP